jgi:hypothetical protein
MRAIVTAIAIAFGAARASAQIPDLPDTMDGQRVIVRTERFASTHTTSLAADYRVDSEPTAGTVRTYMLSSTTLIGVPTTKDQVDAIVDLEYRLPGTMRLVLIGESSISNDVRNNLTTRSF